MSFVSTDPVSHKGKSNVWLTPLWIIEALGNDFDLDPCPYPGHDTSKHLVEGDGLKQQWYGCVWLNPPYNELTIWLDELAEYGYGTALVFNRMETKLMQKHIRLASSVFFLEGRIKFLTPEKKEMHNAGCGSVLISYGWTPDYSKLKGWKAK